MKFIIYIFNFVSILNPNLTMIIFCICFPYVHNLIHPEFIINYFWDPDDTRTNIQVNTKYKCRFKFCKHPIKSETKQFQSVLCRCVNCDTISRLYSSARSTNNFTMTPPFSWEEIHLSPDFSLRLQKEETLLSRFRSST